MLKEKPLLRHLVPRKMVDAPHQIHLGGILMQPGSDNDYIIERIGESDAILCWNYSVADNPNAVVSITQLNTGERWAWTQDTGVFVDTRRSE